MRLWAAFWKAASARLRAIWTREACVCKRGVSLVSGMSGDFPEEYRIIKCPTRASSQLPDSKSVLQECPTRVSHNTVPARVLYISAPQVYLEIITTTLSWHHLRRRRRRRRHHHHHHRHLMSSPVRNRAAQSVYICLLKILKLFMSTELLSRCNRFFFRSVHRSHHRAEQLRTAELCQLLAAQQRVLQALQTLLSLDVKHLLKGKTPSPLELQVRTTGPEQLLKQLPRRASLSPDQAAPLRMMVQGRSLLRS